MPHQNDMNKQQGERVIDTMTKMMTTTTTITTRKSMATTTAEVEAVEAMAATTISKVVV